MKMLPLLGLVLAAVFALAFTNPMDTNQVQYGYDPVEDEWIPLTGMQESVDFECNSTSLPIHCLYDGIEGNPLKPLNTVVRVLP